VKGIRKRGKVGKEVIKEGRGRREEK